MSKACSKVPSRSFFFQAEDGIRDTSVTGVQTCALPIFLCFAGALDYSVVDDAMRSKERPGQIDVFGCHAHTPVVLRTKAGADIIEIGHRPQDRKSVV